jgi:hypothetical protein
MAKTEEVSDYEPSDYEKEACTRWEKDVEEVIGSEHHLTIDGLNADALKVGHVEIIRLMKK